jgi:COP9 signalosome complex subunit 7
MVEASEAKIQQYLLLSKSSRGRALCELINKATAEPGLFAFGELLDTPSINEVGGRRCM